MYRITVWCAVVLTGMWSMGAQRLFMPGRRATGPLVKISNRGLLLNGFPRQHSACLAVSTQEGTFNLKSGLMGTTPRIHSLGIR